MAAIRSKNTLAEHALRRALRERRLTGYRCHYSKLPGKPDIAFTRWRVAIFVDGAFWHGHPDHFTFGKLSNYWDQKVRRTQQRDREQQAALEDAGYEVVRFWDFDVKTDPDRCADIVEERVEQRRRHQSPGGGW